MVTPSKINSIITILPILIAVAFFTLMERKIMGLTHFRPGPNKVGFNGILQPFSDAIKLFSKENQKLKKNNYMWMSASPFMAMIIYTSIWITMTSSGSKMNNKMMMIMFMTIVSLSVFFLVISGWASNSKYSTIGAYRSLAQTISYEIVLILILFPPIIILMMMDLEESTTMEKMPFFIMFPLMLMCWMTTILAETNRTPFDLSESESELVSGYNTEYSSGFFSLIFIAEYSSIIAMSFISAIILMTINQVTMIMITMMIMLSMIWLRVSFPRMRYDKLMEMAWKKLMIPAIIMMMMAISFI